MKARPSDDEIARALRAHVREEEARLADPRWDALARGDAPADEIAELERLAGEDPAARDALALFRPVGEDAESRYAAAIGAELARGAGEAPKAAENRDAGATTAEPARGADDAPKAAENRDAGATTEPAREPGEAPKAPRRIEPAPKRRVIRWVGPATGALALAAGVALFVALRGPGGALPAYDIAFAGGEATSRSEPAAPVPVLAAGSRFTITLRPATAVVGSIEARAFLVQGEVATAIEAEVKLSADGAVRLAGRLGDGIHARAGDAEIVVVVARPDALPSATAIEKKELAEGGDRKVIRKAVRIAEGR